MARLNLLLLVLLALCALGLVTSQHKARKLFVELEKEQERARNLDVEFGQLQLEQSTWAMHGRIERIASRELRMRAPDPKRLQIVERPAFAGSQAPARAGTPDTVAPSPLAATNTPLAATGTPPAAAAAAPKDGGKEAGAAIASVVPAGAAR